MKKIRKTYSSQTISEEEVKSLVTKNVVQCELKGSPVDESRTLIVKISTVNPDRSNDIVDPNGVVLDYYVKNNIVAAFHKYDKPSIGRTIEVRQTDDGIVCKMEFAPKGKNPDADVLFELYKTGFQKAWSIGFIGHEFENLKDGGRKFTKWELLEYSAVLVPDNPEALTLMRSKGLNPDKIIEEQKALENAIVETKDLKETAKPKEDTAKEVKQPEKKDVGEAVSLAYFVDNLAWMIRAFQNNEVKPEVTAKMEQALALIMECLKDEATLGQKSISTTIDRLDIDSKTGIVTIVADDKSVRTFKGTDNLMKTLKDMFEAQTTVKEGRVLSESNRKLVSEAVTQMGEAVSALKALLDATEPKSAKTSKLDPSFIEILKLADQAIGNTLKMAKRE